MYVNAEGRNAPRDANRPESYSPKRQLPPGGTWESRAPRVGGVSKRRDAEQRSLPSGHRHAGWQEVRLAGLSLPVRKPESQGESLRHSPSHMSLRPLEPADCLPDQLAPFTTNSLQTWASY